MILLIFSRWLGTLFADIFEIFKSPSSPVSIKAVQYGVDRTVLYSSQAASAPHQRLYTYSVSVRVLYIQYCTAYYSMIEFIRSHSNSLYVQE